MNNPSVVGRYEIVNRIARGGMGTLYRAWDPKLDRHVAIKLLNEDNEELRQRFAREARSAAGLRHPHIVTIFDVGEDNGRPFIAMEFVQGRTLSALIRSGAQLGIRRKLELIEELCDGLAFAHKAGIVHRDIKPANIMIDGDGEVKILDFGIARVAESTGVTRAGALVGSLNYMSPEQISGRPVDQRSDIFAVGAVFYELLSHRMAFPGGLDDGLLHRLLYTEPEPLASICRDLDAEIERVVARCVQKNPDQRYPELGGMIKDLVQIQARMPITDDVTDVVETKDLAPGAAARLAPTPTPDASRRGLEREELSRRRSSQIQTYLEVARNTLARGDFEGAIAACEEVLLRDAEHGGALDLLDRARAALDEQQAEEWLAQAQREMQRGALTAALTLIERAEALSPTSHHAADLRRMAEEAVRERERARQRAELTRQGLEQAHALFDKGMFREADAAVDDVLVLEPKSPEAIRLKSRTAEAIEAQQRTELERRAREAVREARRIFSSGNHDEAIELLVRFEPQHTLVGRALDQLRADAARLAKERQIEAERRAKEQRIAEALVDARNEVREQHYAEALLRLRVLIDKEGDSPEIAALVHEAEAGQAELDRIANTAREVAEHIARAAGHFARHDLTEALSRVDAALALDTGNVAAVSLRARIQERLRVQAERREAEERRAREREHAIATALEKAERAGSHDAAIAMINELLELDPDHIQARAQLERHQKALALEQSERRRIAEEQLARRDKVGQLLASARQALDRGDLDAAARATASVLQLDPQNPDGQFLADDLAAAQTERDERAAAALVVSSHSSTDELTDLTLAYPGVSHSPIDATAPGPNAQISAGPPAAVRPVKNVAPRSGRVRLYVLTSSAIAVAVVVALVYVATRGPAPPVQPTAPVVSERSPVPPPPAPQVTQPSPIPAPSVSEQPPVSESDRVAALLDQARREMGRGDWQSGLTSTAAGLKLRPGDPGFTRLLNDMWRQSRDLVTKARDSATSAGRAAVGSASYKNAAREEQRANRFGRAGQLDAAIRTSRAASDLYQQAATEGRLAAGRGAGVAAPSSSVPATSAQPTLPPNPPAPPPPNIQAAGNPTAPPPSAASPASPAASNVTAAPPSQPVSQEPVTAPVATAPIATPRPPPVTQPPPPAPVPAGQPPLTPGTAASPPSEEPAVRSVLQAYERAYSNLTADAVKRVYPAVNEQILRRSFADMKSQRLQIQNEKIMILGATATVTCTVDTVFQPQAGRVQHSSRQTVFRLEKRNNVWYIVSLQ